MLSRLQFALTIMFHYIFPPLTIGLGVVLVYLEGMYVWTKDREYSEAARFWTRLFGVNFAMGVVTGIVMEFQFGTNWAAYSRFVGDVFGSALAAEGIFAFFLESGFLALLLFGWDRIGPKLHFFSTVMVCLGGFFSSIWITVANSWQQTPAGHVIREYEVNGQMYQRAEIVDFWAMVFNPSTVNRLVHVWIGAIILGTFFVMSISAWFVLKNRHMDFAKRSFKGALMLGTLACLAQLFSGHSNAVMVSENQPAKMAAMEGHFETSTNVPLYIVGWPDEKQQKVHYGISMPGMLSWLLYGDTNAEIEGLNQLDEKWGTPPVWLTFQSYHLMVAIGMAFIAMTLIGCLLWMRGTLFRTRWLLWLFVVSVVPAVVANEVGWVTAEVGRQPWVVYPQEVDGEIVGGLRTSDAVSESVNASQVLISIIMFGLIYCLLFVVWIVVLNGKIQHGPKRAVVEKIPKHDPHDHSDLQESR